MRIPGNFEAILAEVVPQLSEFLQISCNTRGVALRLKHFFGYHTLPRYFVCFTPPSNPCVFSRHCCMRQHRFIDSSTQQSPRLGHAEKAFSLVSTLALPARKLQKFNPRTKDFPKHSRIIAGLLASRMISATFCADGHCQKSMNVNLAFPGSLPLGANFWDKKQYTHEPL